MNSSSASASAPPLCRSVWRQAKNSASSIRFFFRFPRLPAAAFREEVGERWRVLGFPDDGQLARIKGE